MSSMPCQPQIIIKTHAIGTAAAGLLEQEGSLPEINAHQFTNNLHESSV